MQGKKLLLTAAGLSILFLASPVMAIMSAPYGWYLEGNAGSSHLSKVSYPGSTSSSGIGGNANIGYKFMPFFGMEAGYTQYANSSIDDSSGTKAASIKHYTYDLAARGILPIATSGFELFAKLGIQRIASTTTIKNNGAASALGLASGTSTSTGGYVGAGAQYYFIPELAANVQWQRAMGNSTTGTEDLLSGGVSFIFD